MIRPDPTRPLLCLLSVLALGSLAWGGYHALTGSADLMRRAEEVALFVRGIDPYRDPDMTYPPTSPAVFVPLVAPLAGSPPALRAAWLVLNLAALGAIGAVILRSWGCDWGPSARWAFLVIAAASKPARLAIGMGQYALIPLALVLLAASDLGRRRPVAAGLLLGAALVKPTMVLPFLVVFAVRGRWRTLAVAAGSQMVALAVASGWLGIAPDVLMREWVALARGQQAAGLIDVPSVAARLGLGAAAPAGPIALAVLGLGSAALVAWRDASDLALLAFAGLLAAVSTYHRPYDLVLLLPMLAWLIARSNPAERGRGPVIRVAAAAFFAALLIVPAHPAIVAESTYNAVFIPASYGYLALLTVGLARESKRAAGPVRWSRPDRRLLAAE